MSASSRLLRRLILLALAVIVCIAALHVIAWALVPVLWIALICAIVFLVLRSGGRGR
jgi:hypothetical protein